ncbi:MAG: phytoene/squalene synthase family protein [Alphaproteobacteria bacterium]
MMATETPAQYCATLVNRDDHDRYLTVLHARAADRPALLALYAFGIEVAKTRETVSEPALGEIRLQWWRETVESIFAGECREHPVAHALAQVCGCGVVEERWLNSLIDAREADLYDEQPDTLADLEEYAEATAGRLQAIAALCLGGDDNAMQAGRRVGTAWGLVGLMRAIPFHLAQDRIFVPLDMMHAEGLVDPSQPDPVQSAALGRILKRICGRAEELIDEARGMGPVPASVTPALRLAPLTEGYLKDLARADFVPDSVNYDRGAFGRQLRLAWAGLRRAY